MQIHPPEPTSYRHLIALRTEAFEQRVLTGEIRPVVYPFDFLGLYILLFALCTPLPGSHSNSSSNSSSSRDGSNWRRTVTRWGIAIVISALFLNSLWDARCKVLANGYITGLTTVWGIVWTFTCFVFNDAQAEFRRIVRVSPSNVNELDKEEPKQGTRATSKSANGSGSGDLKQRKLPPSPEDSPSALTFDDTVRGQWESFPATGTFYQRYLWANDLLTNFRGLGWSWKARGLPPVPLRKDWELGTAKSGDVLLTKEEERLFKRRRIVRSVWQFWLCYLLIDALKVAMVADRYFWGLVDSPPPSYLPAIIRDSAILTETYRLIFTMLGAYLALRFVFAGVHYSFLVTLKAFGVDHLSEAWLNVPYNGSVFAILDKGLGGFWGGWWHQLFRFGFVSAGQFICRVLGWDKNARSTKVIFLQGFTAFFISGCFHAAGSYTMDAPTIPWHPFAFFMLQFVGIILQRTVSRVLITPSSRAKIPLVVRRIGNLWFTMFWLWITGRFFADDAAKGGIWLFEPIPVSPIRGLGFGAEGEGWFPVRGTFFAWHRDERHWWRSGIRVY